MGKSKNSRTALAVLLAMSMSVTEANQVFAYLNNTDGTNVTKTNLLDSDTYLNVHESESTVQSTQLLKDNYSEESQKKNIENAEYQEGQRIAFVQTNATTSSAINIGTSDTTVPLEDEKMSEFAETVNSTTSSAISVGGSNELKQNTEDPKEELENSEEESTQDTEQVVEDNSETIKIINSTTSGSMTVDENNQELNIIQLLNSETTSDDINYWTGKAVNDNSWNNPDNWSLPHAPGAYDIVEINGGCVKDIVINSGVEIASLIVTSSYTGMIKIDDTDGKPALIVNNNINISGGTINWNGDIRGNLTVSGGTLNYEGINNKGLASTITGNVFISDGEVNTSGEINFDGKVYINGGTLSLDSKNNYNNTVNLNGGIIRADNISAFGNEVEFNNVDVDFNGNSIFKGITNVTTSSAITFNGQVNFNKNLNIDKNNNLIFNNKYIDNHNENAVSFNGKVNVTTSSVITLNGDIYNFKNDFTADEGTIKVNNSPVFNIYSAKEAQVFNTTGSAITIDSLYIKGDSDKELNLQCQFELNNDKSEFVIDENTEVNLKANIAFTEVGNSSRFQNKGTLNINEGVILDARKCANYVNTGIVNILKNGAIYKNAEAAFTNESREVIFAVPDDNKIYVNLNDYDKNMNSSIKEEVQVIIKSKDTGDEVTLKLTETSMASGVFRNNKPLSVVKGEKVEGDNTLQYNGLEDLEIYYIDSSETEYKVVGNLFKKAIIWTGQGSDDKWNNKDNWKDGIVPGIYDSVQFDSTSSRNVVIDKEGVEFVNIKVAPEYNGTISIAADKQVSVKGNIDIGGGIVNWNGEVKGNIDISGGTLNYISKGNTVHGDIALKGGSLNYNSDYSDEGYTNSINGKVNIDGGTFTFNCGKSNTNNMMGDINVTTGGAITINSGNKNHNNFGNNITVNGGEFTLKKGDYDTNTISGAVTLKSGTFKYESGIDCENNIGSVNVENGNLSYDGAYDHWNNDRSQIIKNTDTIDGAFTVKNGNVVWNANTNINGKVTVIGGQIIFDKNNSGRKMDFNYADEAAEFKNCTLNSNASSIFNGEVIFDNVSRAEFNGINNNSNNSILCRRKNTFNKRVYVNSSNIDFNWNIGTTTFNGLNCRSISQLDFNSGTYEFKGDINTDESSTIIFADGDNVLNQLNVDGTINIYRGNYTFNKGLNPKGNVTIAENPSFTFQTSEGDQFNIGNEDIKLSNLTINGDGLEINNNIILSSNDSEFINNAGDLKLKGNLIFESDGITSKFENKGTLNLGDGIILDAEKARLYINSGNINIGNYSEIRRYTVAEFVDSEGTLLTEIPDDGNLFVKCFNGSENLNNSEENINVKLIVDGEEKDIRLTETTPGTFINEEAVNISGASNAEVQYERLGEVCKLKRSIRRWKVTSAGIWSDKSNWEEGIVPRNFDSVLIPAGTGDIIMDIPAKILNNVTVEAGYTGTISGADDKYLTVLGDFTVNGGTVDWDGEIFGNITVNNNSTFNYYSNSWDKICDNSIHGNVIVENAVFNNYYGNSSSEIYGSVKINNGNGKCQGICQIDKNVNITDSAVDFTDIKFKEQVDVAGTANKVSFNNCTFEITANINNNIGNLNLSTFKGIININNSEVNSLRSTFENKVNITNNKGNFKGYENRNIIFNGEVTIDNNDGDFEYANFQNNNLVEIKNSNGNINNSNISGVINITDSNINCDSMNINNGTALTRNAGNINDSNINGNVIVIGNGTAESSKKINFNNTSINGTLDIDNVISKFDYNENRNINGNVTITDSEVSFGGKTVTINNTKYDRKITFQSPISLYNSSVDFILCDFNNVVLGSSEEAKGSSIGIFKNCGSASKMDINNKSAAVFKFDSEHVTQSTSFGGNVSIDGTSSLVLNEGNYTFNKDVNCELGGTVVADDCMLNLNSSGVNTFDLSNQILDLKELKINTDTFSGSINMDSGINFKSKDSKFIVERGTVNVNSDINFVRKGNRSKFENNGTISIHDEKAIDAVKAGIFINNGTINISEDENSGRILHLTKGMGVTYGNGFPALSAFRFGDEMIISLKDLNHNLDGTLSDEIPENTEMEEILAGNKIIKNIVLKNLTNGDIETIKLTEVEAGSGEFRGSISTEVFEGKFIDNSKKNDDSFQGNGLEKILDSFQVIYVDPMNSQDDYVISKNAPEIKLSAPEIDFSCITDKAGLMVIEIKNQGDKELELKGVSLEKNGAFKFGEEPDTSSIPAYSSREFKVIFNPQNDGIYSDNLIIHSDDKDEENLSIPISGCKITGIDDKISSPSGSNTGDEVVLHTVFSGFKGENSLEYVIIRNTNPALFTNIGINEDKLSFTYAEGKYGIAEIIVRAIKNKGNENESHADVKFHVSRVDSSEKIQIKDGTIEGTNDTIINFTADDFKKCITSQSGVEGNKLTKIKITKVPDEGELKFNGLDVEAEDEIKIENIEGLTFKLSNAGEPVFKWQAKDCTGYSNSANMTMKITESNHAPGFEVSRELTAYNNVGSVEKDNWVHNITAGCESENKVQKIKFEVTNNNTELFEEQPKIYPFDDFDDVDAENIGTLTFKPKDNIEGIAEVTVKLKDNGGEDNNGIDTSPEQTFTMYVDNKINKGTAVINNGNEFTNKREVIVNLNAADSDVRKMRFSNDQETWTEWEKYNSTKNYELLDKDGTKKVYVQFKDGAGNASEPIECTIKLDTINPTISNVALNTESATNKNIIISADFSDTVSGIKLKKWVKEKKRYRIL